MTVLPKQTNLRYEAANRQAHLRNLISRMLAPLFCTICGGETGRAVSLCKSCESAQLEKLFRFRLENDERFCKVCGKGLISELVVCQRCKGDYVLPQYNADERQSQEKDRQSTPEKEKRVLFFEKNFAIFPYVGVCQKLVGDWKNSGMRNYANIFARYVFAFLREKGLDNLSVVPVPPRPKKLRTKGWDQIADVAADLKRRGCTILPCLKRLNGLSQKSVDKKTRAQNLNGKFYVKKSFSGKVPKTVLLLDDIITTGATVNECSRVLRAAGCEHVISLCIFFD